VPSTVVITGASSGIGKALAFYYAARGARLGLLGRNRDRLDAVCARCAALGAENIRSGIIDVRARAELMAWIEDFDRATPIDLLFANAGVSTGTTSAGAFEPNDASYALMETNVLGVFNTVHAILPAMVARGSGQIALLSSLAGFLPLADSPSYCASKSAILAYGRALHDALRRRGVGVSVICPGFVETPMADSVISMKPFQITAEAAAIRIAKALEQRKAVIAFPLPLVLLTRLGQVLPSRVRRWFSPSFSIEAG
jgi:short-subunit dehydrogenase